MRNWKELKEGSLEIPPELRQHFLKFSDRSIPPLNKESVKVDLTPEENLGEFEQIVRKCAAKENTHTDKPTDHKQSLALPSPNSSNTEESFVQSGKLDLKLVTLDELTTKIKNRLKKGNNVDINDRIIISSVNANSKSNSEDFPKEIELVNDIKEANSIVEYKNKAEDPKEVMNYPERIRIPKKAYKKGATYKVNDCYYNHDGRFLYRVLGMSQS